MSVSGTGALSGAGSGALIGTEILPGWGTAIGAGVGGLIGLFGGGSSPSTSPEITSLMNTIKANSATATKNASALTASGSSALDPVLNYYKSLTGGNASAINAATAPQRQRVIDQYDTARKNIATFSPRGGGTNSALAGSQFNQADQLTDITTAAQTDAEKELSGIGTTEQQIGVSEANSANSDLNSVIQAVLGQGEQGIQTRGQNLTAAANSSSALGKLLGTYLTQNKTGGAGGSGATGGGMSFDDFMASVNSEGTE